LVTLLQDNVLPVLLLCYCWYFPASARAGLGAAGRRTLGTAAPGVVLPGSSAWWRAKKADFPPPFRPHIFEYSIIIMWPVLTCAGEGCRGSELPLSRLRSCSHKLPLDCSPVHGRVRDGPAVGRGARRHLPACPLPGCRNRLGLRSVGGATGERRSVAPSNHPLMELIRRWPSSSKLPKGEPEWQPRVSPVFSRQCPR